MSDSGRPETQPDERELAEAAWDAQRDTYFLFEPGAGKAIRNVGAEMLGRLGFDVLAAEDGRRDAARRSPCSFRRAR